MNEPTQAAPIASDREYWNSPHTRVWADQHAVIDALFAGLTEAALDFAAPRPGERVLDIGCGSGTTVMALARRVGAGGEVLGADVAAASVARAASRIAGAGLAQASVVLADAATEAFARQHFDLAFSRFGVMFFADPVAAFANIRGTLQPDGRLALAVFRSPAENPWATGATAAVRHLLPPAPPPGPDDPGQFAFADPARVRRILGGAGFRDIALTPYDPTIRLAAPGDIAGAAAFAMQFGPVARAMRTAAAAERSEIETGMEAFYRRHDGAEGIVLPAGLWLVGARA